MSYNSGFKITANDLNGFYNSVMKLYGVGYYDCGYGQTAIAAPNLSSGSSPIAASNFVSLLQIMNVLAAHQGTTLAATGISPTTGGQVVASTVIPTNITSLYVNRFKATSLQTNSNTITTTYTSNWTGTLYAVITVDFGSENGARYFFNAGGMINVRIVHPNGTSGPDSEWAYALSTNLGTVSIGAHNTTNSGELSGSASPTGYYEFQSAPTEILGMANLSENAPYTNDTVALVFLANSNNAANLNGANGTGFSLTIALSDSYNQEFLAAGTQIALDTVYPTDLVLPAMPSMTLTTPLALATN